MDKDEAVKLLRGGEEGIAEWNRWRKGGREIPDLGGANLYQADLYKADLCGANLSGASLIKASLGGANLSRANLNAANLNVANLSDANLTDANLNAAKLEGANLDRANLRRASLGGANLRGATLGGANLSRANLNGADLDEADLRGANLISANLSEANLIDANLNEAALLRANLRGANLNSANLSSAILAGADLSRAILNDANLDQADLRGANLSGADLSGAKLSETIFLGTRGLRLDGQFIRNALFSPRAKDPWSVLRRNYTGPMMLFHLLFLLAFLAPYATRAAIWTGVNRIQERMDLTPPGPTEEWPLWMLLIGWDKGITYAGTAILVIAYNVLRAFLTWWLAQLRDAEERSGCAPTWNSYKHSFWAHYYFMRYVFWFAVLSFLWHAIPWLFHVVELPQRA